MGRSLGLAAYMALSRRHPKALYQPNAPRPSGQLVWAHATDSIHADALIQMAERLLGLRPNVSILITGAMGTTRPAHLKPPLLWEELTNDSMHLANAFLDHWRPDICLWTGGTFMPAMIKLAHDRALPMYLVDACKERTIENGTRWLPDLSLAMLSRFDAVLARDKSTAQAFRRLGVDPEDISVTGPLLEGSKALPCVQSDRDDLAQSMAGRPVWLAAMIQTDELDTVLGAHRIISRYAHRLLLIIVPDDPSNGPMMHTRITADGWRAISWSDGAFPDETTQILLADTHGEMGLWFRVSPISFMGSSLTSGHAGRDPNEPAAHGSAILYGPNVRRYLTSYSRFAGAGAARIVRDTPTLAAAVQTLMAPEKSAAMAHAAWDIATQSANVMDHVLNLVQDTLDVLEIE